MLIARDLLEYQTQVPRVLRGTECSEKTAGFICIRKNKFREEVVSRNFLRQIVKREDAFREVTQSAFPRVRFVNRFSSVLLIREFRYVFYLQLFNFVTIKI